MFRDLSAVIWKEVHEFFFIPGNWVRLIFFIALTGFIIPFSQGKLWFNSPLTVLLLVMEPVFLVLNMIADAFAGERERHTLETLLASRLSDRSILFGKLLPAITYGLIGTLGLLVVGLVAANIRAGNGSFLFYSGEVLLGSLLLSLLTVIFMATIGILVSLKSATVRQAQQTLSLSYMVVFFGMIAGVQLLPRDWLSNFFAFAGNLGDYGIGLILIIAAILVVLDLALISLVMAKFQRSRLILS
jgi:ABC-2 type transport system permease protein